MKLSVKTGLARTLAAALFLAMALPLGAFAADPGYEQQLEDIQQAVAAQGRELSQTTVDLLRSQPEILAQLVNGTYPRNSMGETYGNNLQFQVLGYEADLQAAIGTEGESGYIRTSDIIGSDFVVNTPEDAMRYMEFMATQPDSYLIPLYDVEGNVIGQFRYGGSEALAPEMIDARLTG